VKIVTFISLMNAILFFILLYFKNTALVKDANKVKE